MNFKKQCFLKCGWLLYPLETFSKSEFYKKRLHLKLTINSVWLLMALITISLDASAQDVNGSSGISVKGVVKDERGQTLSSVSVSIKGASKATLTSSNGSYAIVVPSENSILVFSNLGFIKQEIRINNKEVVNVILKEENFGLNEVVVVGYNAVRKSDLTGSVSTVKASDLKKTPIASLDQGLQGRAAGVQVTQNSGAPGGAISVRVRGGNSISSSNEPLYVIDGFPVSGSSSAATGGTGVGASAGNQPNALAGINPNDIESIEILKDAAGTAIYGSRGANGVVLITTKKGKAGATKVDYELYVGAQKVNKTLDLLSATEFAKLENIFTPNLYADPNLFLEGTDWQKEIFRTAPIQNHQLSVSGGNEKTLFNISANYFNQQGIIIASGYKRGSLRFNIDHKINSKVKFGTNLTLSRSVNNVSPSSDPNDNGAGILASALWAPPTIPVYAPNGKFYLFQDYLAKYPFTNNPVALANDVLNQNTTNRILGNVYADVNVLKGLTYRFSLGGDFFMDKRDSYVPRSVQSGLALGGSGGFGALESSTYLHESILNYSTTFNKDHKLDVTAVYSTQSQIATTASTSVQGFPSDVLQNNNLGLGTPSAVGTSKNKWILDSYTARVNYNYQSKYLLSLTSRIDGSTKFGTNNKYGFFPAVAFAWKLSEEQFLVNSKTISELKIRTSYGITGNADIPLYQSLFRLGTSNNFNYNFNNVRNVGIGTLSIPNQNLKWEKTTTYNLGIDAGFLNNRISITADAYLKSTSDLLISRAVALSSGFGSYFGNFGAVENKGIELGISGTPLNGEFKWDINANISFNRNKLTRVDGLRTEIIPASNGGGNVGAFLNSSILRVGAPVGSFYGYIFDGIWQTPAEIAAGHMKTSQPGSANYRDFNKDGVLSDADRTIIGNPNPDFIYGITNNLSYKDFDLSAFIQGSKGNDIFNVSRLNLESSSGGKNQLAATANRWTTATPSNLYVKAVSAQRLLPSTAYIEDGSYVRLKNITLGYSLSASAFKTKWASKLRIYASANNLFTITNYQGFDPEVNTTGQSDVTNFGIDNNGYPIAKSFILGLQVGF
ncbi:MAG: TonB-dependent receptor [Flavobacterium sp.]|nr:TonB-dependent receptor [Pedobacter sp.]